MAGKKGEAADNRERLFALRSWWAWRRAHNASGVIRRLALAIIPLAAGHGAAVKAAPGSAMQGPARKVRRRITANGYSPYVHDRLGVGRITPTALSAA